MLQRKRSVGQWLSVHKITLQAFLSILASTRKLWWMQQRFTSSKPHSVIGFRCLSVPEIGFVGNVGRLKPHPLRSACESNTASASKPV